MESRIQQLDTSKYAINGNLLSREQGKRVLEGIKGELERLSVDGTLFLDLRKIHYATAACFIEILSILDMQRELRDRYIILRSKSDNSDLNDCLALALKEKGKVIWWLDEKDNWGILGELTKAQKDTLGIVRGRKGVTSTEMSELLNIPVNTASNRLKDLYDMKLIMRGERIISSTGGRQFIYHVCFVDSVEHTNGVTPFLI